MKEREGKKDKERGGRETGKIHEEREEEGKERERSDNEGRRRETREVNGTGQITRVIKSSYIQQRFWFLAHKTCRKKHQLLTV